MEITIELLHAVCPTAHENDLWPFLQPLNEVCEHYDINTPERVAAFLAQVAHESGSFRAIKENLNYRAPSLMAVFKKYFPTQQLAEQYAHHQEQIANRVYANRMGNGDEASGDGYRFCGRGLIQLTGKSNYTRFAADLDLCLEDTVSYMETADGAVASAGWFWHNNNLNQYCDSGDFTTLTKRINGGTHGLEDRQARLNRALAFLQG